MSAASTYRNLEDVVENSVEDTSKDTSKYTSGGTSKDVDIMDGTLEDIVELSEAGYI